MFLFVWILWHINISWSFNAGLFEIDLFICIKMDKLFQESHENMESVINSRIKNLCRSKDSDFL